MIAAYCEAGGNAAVVACGEALQIVPDCAYDCRICAYRQCAIACAVQMVIRRRYRSEADCCADWQIAVVIMSLIVRACDDAYLYLLLLFPLRYCV